MRGLEESELQAVVSHRRIGRSRRRSFIELDGGRWQSRASAGQRFIRTSVGTAPRRTDAVQLAGRGALGPPVGFSRWDGAAASRRSAHVTAIAVFTLHSETDGEITDAATFPRTGRINAEISLADCTGDKLLEEMFHSAAAEGAKCGGTRAYVVTNTHARACARSVY